MKKKRKTLIHCSIVCYCFFPIRPPSTGKNMYTLHTTVVLFFFSSDQYSQIHACINGRHYFFFLLQLRIFSRSVSLQKQSEKKNKSKLLLFIHKKLKLLFSISEAPAFWCGTIDGIHERFSVLVCVCDCALVWLCICVATNWILFVEFRHAWPQTVAAWLPLRAHMYWPLCM